MGRGAGFSLGGAYSSNRPQQQQQRAPSVSGSGVSFTPANNQELTHMHGSDMFTSSHSMYHMPQVWLMMIYLCESLIDQISITCNLLKNFVPLIETSAF